MGEKVRTWALVIAALILAAVIVVVAMALPAGSCAVLVISWT